MNYGLIQELKSISEYILGKSIVPYIQYNQKGDWTDFLPQYESQSPYYETFGCSVWGTQNQIETFMKFLYGTEYNFSENFTYLLTPVDPKKGADPQKVYDCVRTYGLIDNALLSVPKTLAAFCDKKRITEKMYQEGKKWLYLHEVKHEWLWSKRPENYIDVIKDALKTSPIAVSVSAWFYENGKFVDNNTPNNHWCVCYNIDDDGIHIFDSYDNSRKILSLTHKINLAKRIWINEKTTKSAQRHIRILQDLISFFTKRMNLLTTCKNALGTDASPKDNAPDDFGCSETVTTLLKQVYPETPIILGTWTLWRYLEDPKNKWERVTDYAPETIVISPTGTGRGTGHVGIVLDDELIASNNSFGNLKGKFTINYTKETWKKKYVDTQSMPVYLYRRVV